ncbi:unnamed protein product, partial [Rotaria magnacalcarata]
VEGVVLYDNGITTNISHSNGQSYSRRSLKINDNTGTINITIWNEKIVEVPEQVVNKTIRMRNGKINHYHGPVHETLDEMRQRFEQNRDEQERIERNHEVLAESRRSKVSMRSDDGSEQRYPEKVILLARGTKIPWINISLSHGGYKAATLHQAAANLQSENLGMFIFSCAYL